VILRSVSRNALVLGLFAVLGTALLALTEAGTRQRIADNEREALLHTIYVLVPSTAHDNDLFHDTREVQEPLLLGTRAHLTAYRARKNSEPTAVILAPVAPDGYSGDIRLLVAIRYDGTLAGVRVLSHRETPGLGDGIEAERSPWIQQFAGKSLRNPDDAGWKVRRDGGKFDQLTGATITSRAVVKAVYRALQFYASHREELFEPAQAGAPQPPGAGATP